MNSFGLSILTIVSSLLLFNCAPKAAPENILASSSPEAEDGINRESFCRHWIHSPEEELTTDSIKVYRLRDFKEFPPRRFRMQYIFQTNGDCEWYFLSPDDAHRFKRCEWQIDPRDKDVINIVKDDEKESLRIIELTKEILRFEEIEAND